MSAIQGFRLEAGLLPGLAITFLSSLAIKRALLKGVRNVGMGVTGRLVGRWHIHRGKGYDLPSMRAKKCVTVVEPFCAALRLNGRLRPLTTFI